MIKKIFGLTIAVLIGINANSQVTNDYGHCDCTEKVNYSDTDSQIRDGEYILTCKGKTIEKGEYKNGLKSGTWILRNQKGVIISKIDYENGVISGNYEMFHFGGKPKLVASFDNGKPVGIWKYFNEKGKIIKTGEYKDGIPVGVWTVMDLKGKKEILKYDFDKKEYILSSNTLYYPDGGVLRDDESGEWCILYYPKREAKMEIKPIEGYKLSSDFFADYVNIPTVLMNTYVTYEFRGVAKISNGVISDFKLEYKEDADYFEDKPSYPFIVTTNPPDKLKRIEHKIENIESLRERLEASFWLIGPWIPNADGEIEIQIPFILNDIKKFN